MPANIVCAFYIFDLVLNKYGLSLNKDKTAIEDFPFYTYVNYEKLQLTNEIINDYTTFANIEKFYNQKGALYYFISNI